ncbi:MAG: D-alanyl-D-alanine carboxypeptidase family protein, partial [Lachnospiraceae bacterium]
EDADQNQFISVILKAGSRPDLYDNMTNIIQKIVN